MKGNDIFPFFKTPSTSFYGKNLKHNRFLNIFKNQPPFYKAERGEEGSLIIDIKIVLRNFVSSQLKLKNMETR